jgi:hypothetical protein
MKNLRIIPPRMPHDDVIIEGNREGIQHLISLLTRSIEANETATAIYTGRENTFFPPDGEGYYVNIRMLEKWEDNAVDYYSDYP